MEYTTIHDVTDWIGTLDDLLKDHTCKAPSFLKPFHFTTLTHALKGKANSLNLPEKLAGYANRMGLWEAVGVTPPPYDAAKKIPYGRFHPVEVLKNPNKIEQTSNLLSTLLLSSCQDEQTKEALPIMFSELIDNCYSHSGMSNMFYGTVCAQVWPAGNKAQISIADVGVGVRASLSANPKLSHLLNNANSCELATDFGITGKPNKNHSGYGLSVTRGLIEQVNGSMILVSGDEYFSITRGKRLAGSVSLPWRGTLLVIEWNTSSRMDIGEVYDNLPLPEGYSDDDFDF